jgi:hypothetical protein
MQEGRHMTNSEERRVSSDFGLMFVPERWASVSKFRQFMGPPFKVDRELITGTNAAELHLAKFSVLAGLANRLKGQLAEDQAELAEKGHTPANRSKEFAALIEALFCGLYSVLDGVRRTLFSAFQNVRGIQNGSTERLFRRAREHKYGPEFPEDIRQILASAYDTWFPRLRSIRTEVTHGEIGSCHLDATTGKVFYMHVGLGTQTQALVIEDIIEELNQKAQSVSALVEAIYQELFSRLEPLERRVPCGIYKGRFYERVVAPSSDLSVQSGRCASLMWFDKEAEYLCPLKHSCTAYQRSAAVTE